MRISYDGKEVYNLPVISYHGVILKYSRVQESVVSIYNRFMESRMIIRSNSGHVYRLFPNYSYSGLNITEGLKVVPIFLDRSDRIKNVKSTIKVPLSLKVNFILLISSLTER